MMYKQDFCLCIIRQVISEPLQLTSSSIKLIHAVASILYCYSMLWIG